MRTLLKIRENVKKFYGSHTYIIDCLGRFVFSFFVLFFIRENTNYNEVFSNLWVLIGLSLISAFLPTNLLCITTGIYLLVQLASVSLEVAVIAGLFIAIMILLYFVFRAKDSHWLMLTLGLCLTNLVPAILPMGLLFAPVQVLVIVFGVILYGLILVVQQNFSMLSGNTLTLSGRVGLLLSNLFSNEKVLLLLVALTLSLLIIIGIRKLKANYSPFIAVIAGGLLFVISFLLGSYFMNLSINWVLFSLGILLNIALSFFILNFVMKVDYKKAETIQFEDEDYVYYVKAIPKVGIAVTEKKVENITGAEADSLPDDDMNLENLFRKKEEKEG